MKDIQLCAKEDTEELKIVLVLKMEEIRLKKMKS